MPPVKFKSPLEWIVVSTVPPIMLAVPPVRISREARLAELIKVPPVTVAFAPEPEVMVVTPLLMSISPPETLRFVISMVEFKVPLTVVIDPVTLPPVRLTEPFSRYSESRVALLVRLPPRIRVVFAVPPVRFAEPPMTVIFRRVTFEVNDPLDTVVRPVTFPPVKPVFPPLIFRVFIDPLDMEEFPEVTRVPIVPLEIARDPFESTVRFEISMDVSRIPPVIVAFPRRVPPDMFDVPFVTVTPFRVPPVTVRTPAEDVAPTTVPPVISADPD